MDVDDNSLGDGVKTNPTIAGGIEINPGLGIVDLPDILFLNVLEYLVDPERPSLAAVAFAIIGPHPPEQFDTLDFGEIEKADAERFTDEDIGAILTCINAKDTLKTLKLAGCVNITGSGLEPLRGSSVIKQMDLSLVEPFESPDLEQERPDLEQEPSLYYGVVLPILSSIVRTPGSSLKQLELPKHFFTTNPASLNLFLREYSQLLDTRGSRCSKCNGNCLDDDEPYWVNHFERSMVHSGLQNFICYTCKNWYCLSCNMRWFCNHCEKAYCIECADFERCNDCTRDYCGECIDSSEFSLLHRCANCELHFCDDHEGFDDDHEEVAVFDRPCCGRKMCCTNCTPYYVCGNDECAKAHCAECSNDEKYNVGECLKCGRQSCPECILDEWSKDWENFCASCVCRVLPLFQEKKKFNFDWLRMCNRRRNIEGCTREHCLVCGLCQDNDATHCPRCNKCRKQHCDKCSICEVTRVSECDDCHTIRCVECHIDSLLMSDYWSCDGCIKAIVPTVQEFKQIIEGSGE